MEERFVRASSGAAKSQLSAFVVKSVSLYRLRVCRRVGLAGLEAACLAADAYVPVM